MRRAVLVLVVALVGFVYLFVVSAGTLVRWPTYSNYYDLLAEGFRAGHLYLPIEPSPQLLAKENPFDPANASLWVWDASLHGGRYYLYWGPLPALIQAVVKTVLGISRRVGDQYLLFGFSIAYLVLGTLLVDRIARKLHDAIPLPLVVLAVLAFAFANPIPHSLASPGIYQTAILAAQAFLLGGLLFAFDAVERSASGKEPDRKLLAAGISWALALACRVSVAPAVALLILVTALAVRRSRPIVPLSLRLAAPAAVALFGLLAYNAMRFGSWLEFGTGVQLSTMRFVTSAAYVPANAYSYAFRPYELSATFPFVLQVRGIGEAGFPGWLRLQPGYSTAEPLVGFLLAVPWIWLAPIGAVACAVRARAADARSRLGLWCAASFLVLGLVTGLPELSLFLATMRYLGDVTAGLVLLGVLGGFWWYSRARSSGAVALGMVGVATILIGLLLGFQGYEGHFRIHNPELHDRLVGALSIR